jgi:hypothetical protein
MPDNRTNLPPQEIQCFHVMHCGHCDKGYYSLAAGQKHENRCKKDE